MENSSKNTIFQLKKIITEIRSYPENEWMKAEIFKKYVSDLNICSKKLGLLEFVFESFHFSSTEKTINQRGYKALINHIKILESMMPDFNVSVNEDADDDGITRVFIVHGRDRQAMIETENLVRRIGLQPIVLSRMANGGATIIEKFEKYSDVKYALVLLTPDDIGALNEENPNYSFRARQNVLFELGFFYGKLGRQNVCCIVKANVERPSDIDGIVYLRFNSNVEEIEYDLMKELNAAQIKFKLFN
ncbi:TIR domain-containing protein [Paenibacillus sp. OAS669]|uniref:TIR domain-containing protein n=1 Tax=Paenibacillus sp. OAS669 TaxID=2663821 RepID=UPI00178B9587|nr:nucleotide-binding protein [Paenibacillus sp. OAS669]MBE1446072.1 putative nucleotide-binding protein [Paenibacillus sp. OAS669]